MPGREQALRGLRGKPTTEPCPCSAPRPLPATGLHAPVDGRAHSRLIAREGQVFKGGLAGGEVAGQEHAAAIVGSVLWGMTGGDGGAMVGQGSAHVGGA